MVHRRLPPLNSLRAFEAAALLGITDTWDFAQHKIRIERIDVPGLKHFGRRYSNYEEDVDALCALMQAGFEFHFRPEG